MSVYQPQNINECKLLFENSSSPLIIKYSTHWCGPCKAISPLFHDLSQQYPNVCFIEIDTEVCGDFEPCRQVTALPTFEIWSNHKLQQRFTGANRELLTENLKRFR